LVSPYVEGATLLPALYAQLSTYLDLLVKWNARTNLTSIREPEEMVRRHFGESLFAGAQLADRVTDGTTLLDFGSGAGFPGLPIQLSRPELAVTLAESQGKKASFLREAVRTLGLKTEVWAGRVETMPPVAGVKREFDVVTMRAVDDMGRAVVEARGRVKAGGMARDTHDRSPGRRGSGPAAGRRPRLGNLRASWVPRRITGKAE